MGVRTYLFLNESTQMLAYRAVQYLQDCGNIALMLPILEFSAGINLLRLSPLVDVFEASETQFDF
jgi:hypothetical protein